jgi:hypothetical protein
MLEAGTLKLTIACEGTTVYLRTVVIRHVIKTAACGVTNLSFVVSRSLVVITVLIHLTKLRLWNFSNRPAGVMIGRVAVSEPSTVGPSELVSNDTCSVPKGQADQNTRDKKQK